MERLFDIHSHLVFGVDDGARDLLESMELIGQAWAQGVRGMILTPHYGIENGHAPDRALVREHFEAIRNACRCDMLLRLGCENYGAPAMLDRLRRGEALTMNGTAYVLYEFMEWGKMSESESVILARSEEIAASEYTPILAHAERYRNLWTHYETVYPRLKEMGVLLQINAYDVIQNPKTAPVTQWLLKNELVDFIGSDAHNMIKRCVEIKTGADWIRANCRPAYANRILWDNAMELLAGGDA